MSKFVKVLFFVHLICFFISSLWCKDINKEELKEKSITVEKEIDELFDKMEKIKDVSLPLKTRDADDKKITTKVITPPEIIGTLIPYDKRGQKMNLEFTQTNLEDVMRLIGTSAGINIVLDPQLKGIKVDMHLVDVSIEEALSLIYNAYGLSSYQVGGSLYVSTKEKIKKETLVTKVIELKNVSVVEAESLIKDLVEIINKSPEKNTLVVMGNPDDINKVEDILRKVDFPQRQVILEAKIIEINITALKEIGVDWSDSIAVGFQESRRPVTFDDPEDSIGATLRVYKLARNVVQFNTVIKMLQNDSKAKVLSNPRVVTMNNKEAEIFVGDEIPYTVTTISGGVATTEVRFVKPGIRLKITPSIIEENFVVLKVEPEVSSITGFRGPNDEFPQVRTREATAYVRVKNNEPFVLGGLLSKEDKKENFKVPLIGDIPILGKLFRYEKDTGQDTELIITVTPTIVSGDI